MWALEARAAVLRVGGAWLVTQQLILLYVFSPYYMCSLATTVSRVIEYSISDVI